MRRTRAPELLPPDREAARPRSLGRHGVGKLMAAVLEDAITVLTGTGSAAGMRAREEAMHWIRSDERRSPFSFVALCEALDIDPESVRLLVLRRAADAAKQARRSGRRGEARTQGE